MALPDPNTTPGNTQPWTPELWLQRFKEIVTAILGISIVVFTLILAVQAFGVLNAGTTLDKDRIAAAKDILLLVTCPIAIILGDRHPNSRSWVDRITCRLILSQPRQIGRAHV